MAVPTNLPETDGTANALRVKSLFAIDGIWRREILSGIALLIIFLAVSLPRLNGPIDLRWDASTYYVTRNSAGRRQRLSIAQ